MDIGYDLFSDKSSLKTTFIAADVFDQNSALQQLDGKMNVVHGASFLHLFDLEGQVNACKRIVKLLRDEPGSMFLGRQIGNLVASTQAGRLNPNKQRYRHNVDSFQKMWQQVGDETGTEWKVEAHFGKEDLYAMAKEACIENSFVPEGSRWLSFAVRRTA